MVQEIYFLNYSLKNCLLPSCRIIDIIGIGIDDKDG